MYSKFENFMKKYLAPLADKMDKEVHLSAVKKAMVAMTPLLIIGSFCLIPEAIPNMIGEKHVISQWILANLDIIYIPYNVGMALMSVYVTVIIAYQLATSYKLDIPGCVTMGLVSFLMLVVEFTEDGGISKTYLGPKGLFCAMFAGFIAVELFRWAISACISAACPSAHASCWMAMKSPGTTARSPRLRQSCAACPTANMR